MMSKENIPQNNNVVFKNNKLYRFIRNTRIEVCSPWPPRAWKKCFDKIPAVWEHCRPTFFKIPRVDITKTLLKSSSDSLNYDTDGIQLLFPFIKTNHKYSYKLLAYLRFYEVIPKDIRDIVKLYPEREWHILSFLYSCGLGGKELAIMNPSLAFCLANNSVYRHPPLKQPLRAARNLVFKKQRVIQEWLQFPDSECCRKILTKITYNAINIQSMFYLRESLQNYADITLKHLCHLNKINSNILRTVTDPDLVGYVNDKFLYEISSFNASNKPSIAYTLKKTISIYSALYPNKKIPIVGSVNKLNEIYDEVCSKLQKYTEKINIYFNAPPIPGNNWIIPLTSSYELHKEGEEMHNCCSQYTGRLISSANLYIYKILYPERCTLLIVKRNNRWMLGSVKKSYNRSASLDTIDKINMWLQKQD